MDHNQAIELNAAEKYVLRELPEDLQEAYEQHFFDCSICAADIKAAAIFAETTREIFAEEHDHPATDPERGSVWSRWLRPAIAVPVFAALLLLVGYQNLVTIPQLKSGPTASLQVLNTFSLAAADSRGGAVRIPLSRGQGFALDFDIPSAKGFAQFLCQLRDDSGRVLHQVTVTAEQANKTVELFVPAGMMHPGTYSIVIAGDADHNAQFREQNQIAKLNFEVVLDN